MAYSLQPKRYVFSSGYVEELEQTVEYLRDENRRLRELVEKMHRGVCAFSASNSRINELTDQVDNLSKQLNESRMRNVEADRIIENMDSKNAERNGELHSLRTSHARLMDVIRDINKRISLLGLDDIPLKEVGQQNE